MNKIIYLDAAASALKPKSVIDAEVDFLHNSYATSGRGICARRVAVDDMVMQTRNKVAKFINADANQIVFTSGATDGLNRIANILTNQDGYSNSSVVAVSDLDHHSARLPWVELLHRGKISQIQVCDLDENFDIKTDAIPKADILVITAMSNVLGCAQDVEKITAAARNKNPNVITIVDASQYVVHNKIDVKKWNCDFLVFSGHKIGADTGIGILYIRDSEKYSVDKFGGGMVTTVIGNDMILESVPTKWEAGTLPLTQIAGLNVAIEESEKNRPDLNLIKYAYDELSQIEKIKIITLRDSAILSFVVDDMHPLDVGAMLGAHNICVRVGNMCASWIHKRIGVSGTIRISVGSWNTMDEIEQVIEVIKNIVK